MLTFKQEQHDVVDQDPLSIENDTVLDLAQSSLQGGERFDLSHLKDTQVLAEVVKSQLKSVNMSAWEFVKMPSFRQFHQLPDLLLKLIMEPKPWNILTTTETKIYLCMWQWANKVSSGNWKMPAPQKLQVGLARPKQPIGAGTYGGGYQRLVPNWAKPAKNFPPSAISFDNQHVAELVLAAIKLHSLSVSDVANYVLDEDEEKVNIMLQFPQPWDLLSEDEQHIYQTLAEWLHKTALQRLEPINMGRKAEGLPEQVSVPSESDDDSETEMTSERKRVKAINRARKQKEVDLMGSLLGDLKAELQKLGITELQFAQNVLGESIQEIAQQTSILYQAPKSHHQLQPDEMQKYLKIQSWMCKPVEQKMANFNGH